MPRYKLTKASVQLMRTLYVCFPSIRQRHLAEMFEVKQATVSLILRNKRRRR